MNNFAALFGLTALLALAASANSQPLAPGNLLVATPKSHDPDFAHSVVLLIRYDSQSAIGLMLNKPTNLPISEFLPEVAKRPVTVYAGGPVSIGVCGLLRSSASPFFTVISNKSQLLRMIASGVPAFRVYAGYTGWTSPQLESEIARQLWKVLPPNPSTPFDPHPDTLWQRLTLPRPIR